MKRTTDGGHSIRVSLTRLRAAVLIWCALVIVSIVMQIVAWSITAFSDLRYSEPAPQDTLPVVVAQADDVSNLYAITQADIARVYASTQGLNVPERERSGVVEELSINDRGVKTKWDRFVLDMTNWSGAVGTLSILLIVPLVLLGTLIAVVGRYPGVELAISAFIWSIIIATLTLPLANNALAQPWQDGIFRSGQEMVADVEDERADYGGHGLSYPFFLRYVGMPIVCIVGVVLLAARFSSGVAAGLVAEAQRLDPVLEREAQRVAQEARSLFGGRTSGALKRTLGRTPAPDPLDDDDEEEFDGSLPRRVI